MWDAMKADANSTVGRLLRTFLKTPDDWYEMIGRGIVKLQDGDKIHEIKTCIHHRFFGIYGFDELRCDGY